MVNVWTHCLVVPNPGAGLVGAHHRLGGEPGLESGDERGEPAGSLELHLAQPAGRHRRIEELAEQLGGPLDGQVLTVQQVDGQRPNLGSPTHRGSSGGRERSDRDRPAPTPAFRRYMVGHRHPHRGDIDHLAGRAHHQCVGRVAPAAGAAHRLVSHAPVGLASGQVCSRSAELLASFASLGSCRGAALGPGLTATDRIRRRRLRAVGRVLAGGCLQPGDTIGQPGVLSDQTSDLRTQQHVLRQRFRQQLFDRPPNYNNGLSTLARRVVDLSRAPRADHPEWLR